MATLTMTIPDEVLPDLIDALAIPNGWTSTQASGPKGDFAKAVIRAWLRTQVREWRVNQARVDAAAAEAATVDAATEPVTVT